MLFGCSVGFRYIGIPARKAAQTVIWYIIGVMATGAPTVLVHWDRFPLHVAWHYCMCAHSSARSWTACQEGNSASGRDRRISFRKPDQEMEDEQQCWKDRICSAHVTLSIYFKTETCQFSCSYGGNVWYVLLLQQYSRWHVCVWARVCVC